MLKSATLIPNFSPQLRRAASLNEWPIKHGNVIHRTTIQPFYFLSMSSSAKDKQKRIKQLVNAQPQDGWDKCWEERITPWDLGNVTPIISYLLLQNDHQRLPHGRALVPGCGTGYDVIALADPSRYVIGIDISEKAISQAKELAAHSPNSRYCQFLKTDFFTWKPSELFDLIFDYTFFCAIEPSMRPAWGKCIAELLKFDGELITLIFPISDHEGGPPYSVSLKSYEDALHPWGFKALYVADNEMAIKGRKGRELVARWKRDAAKL